MVCKMVRRHVVRISLVSSIGLALVTLLLLLASQPRQAFAKTNSLGVLRQTGTSDALSITGTTGMNNVDIEAMGHAMSHLIMALDVLHEMQQQHLIHSSATMGEMGTMTGTTDTTAAMASNPDAGALIEVMGHMAESMGYMHEAMGYHTMGVGAADTSAMMNGGGADLSPMLDILDQMVQATISQLPTLSGMPGATATGTTTDTVGTDATDAATATMAMGAMTGAFDPSPMLPAMAQTLQAMADQLRGMTDATAMEMTGATTDTTGMGTDMMGTGTPSLRQALQAIGQSMELMGHMHMMLATVNSGSEPGAATAGTGDDIMGLINEMAQAMSDQVSVLTGGDTSGMDTTSRTTEATGTGTATTAMTDTAEMTDTAGMTDTTETTGTTDSDAVGMGMNSANPALSSAAQLIQTTLLQIQGMAGGVDSGTDQ